jgi:hypothetical protein
MLRVIALTLLCVSAAGIAAAQQNPPKASPSRQARSDESCLKFHSECGLWCEANQSGAANKATCKSQCDGYQSTCLQTGVWSTPVTRVEIRGLPAK